MEQVANRKPIFIWSDAWVLAAVAVGGGLKGCGLKDIIAAGELINRALLNSSEIRNALGKLIHAGFVTRRSQDSFVIGGDARTAVEKLLKESTASFSVMQFFEDFLEVDPYTVNDAEYDDSQFALSDLSDADVEAAARAYQEDLQNLWRELRQIDKRSLSERAVKFLEEVGRDR
jgi:DNA-binding GntR family transcriptional regulator